MNAPATSMTPYDAPLHGGLVVEASAGTGKTYTLTTLVARLIVEACFPIEKLLIVTFTIAATGELRSRVWQTLRAARDAVRGNAANATAQASELAKRWGQAGAADADARLTRAIRDFDRATITTIHGFCQRALTEFALDAGLPFKFAVSGDGALEVASATRDFWRTRMAYESVSLLEYAKAQKFVLDAATAWTAQQHAKPNAIRPDASPEELERNRQRVDEQWAQAFQNTCAAWADSAQRQTFEEVWDTYRWLAGKKDEAVYRSVTAALDADNPDLLSLKDAGFFGRASLAEKLFKRSPPPDIALYDQFERLGEAAEELGEYWLTAKRRTLLADATETLHQHALADRSLTFDALLAELHRALHSHTAPALAARMRARYPVALIDEFQDTDRLQAQIFEAMYPVNEERGGLIVVGDPKQSIYRFRGADVFAYVDARDRLDADRALKLRSNYRSTADLVHAVNAVFEGDNALLLPEVAFEPARAAAVHDKDLRIEDADYDPKPFQLHLFAATDAGKKWAKGALTQVAAGHAAERIVRLLELARSGKAYLVSDDGPKSLQPTDIAVLVRSGDQGQAMIQALRNRGVRTVEIGTDSVLDSAEADSLHRLLQALATDEFDTSADRRLRGVLAADLFGLDMTALDALQEDDRTWAGWKDRAREWRRIWAADGVATLMRHLLFADDPACATNLLEYDDGPRRLTNFLHLTDLLHDAESRERLSRRALLDWFAHFRVRSDGTGETAQLRLESDEDLVKIVTIHRAKGLEFPVVFCPFAWSGHAPDGKVKTAEYYDRAAKAPVLDLQPSASALDAQAADDFADELRLLYVALTRAQYRCEVTWAYVNLRQFSPLAWLLHRTVDDATARANAERVKNLAVPEWLTEARGFADRAPTAIAVHDAVPTSTQTLLGNSTLGKGSLAARQLRRGLRRNRQLTSYSALSAGTGAAESATDHETVEAPDHDTDEPVSAEVRHANLDAFGFPAGSRPGSCLHEIFERRLDADDLEAICRDALARYGIDAKWLPTAQAIATDAWGTPLRTGKQAFALGDVERPIAEMEFHLPLRGFRREQLADVLAGHGYDRWVPDGHAAIDGYLHGFIDVVARHDGRWYVMDYKSNWLGNDLAAYSAETIAASMRQHRYHLQYLLYVTALHRLLRIRLPDYDYDRDIGGACYLFVRAMRPSAPGYGVHYDRPSRACIEAIDACFEGAEHVA